MVLYAGTCRTVVYKGYLALRYAALNQLRFNVVVHIKAPVFVGRAKITENELGQAVRAGILVGENWTTILKS